MRKILVLTLTVAISLLLAGHSSAARKEWYEGYKKCGGCHKSQKDSWLETKHAKAFEVLKPNVKVEDKKKAKLDPKKDYTADEKCVGCHVTGYKEARGYSERMPETKASYYVGVGCEECHGPGSLYRKEHRKAGRKFKATEDPSPRKVLVRAGQNFDYEEACNRCHLNYKGSPWKKAKEPYTPFTPEVDPEYEFDFDKAVKDDKAMHEHFKLRGVYTGEPVPKIRAEFQKTAKEPAEPEEDEDEEADDEGGKEK